MTKRGSQWEASSELILDFRRIIQMSLEAGEIVVVLEFAQGLKDMDFFGKQDPFCILNCGSQSYKSKTHNRGGTSPA
jgi:Ca2+-dependent lipid-binding protein